MVSLKDLLPGKAFTTNAEDLTTGQVAITDASGRTVGLEDPNDPRLQDDPAIFPSNNVTAPETGTDPSKKLLNSTGKPFIDPRLYGGSTLDQSAGLGEPLNVIISALSGAQKAFLDPRGWVDENFLYREVYTPLESFMFRKYQTKVEYLTGLIEPGTTGINHDIATDGRVALLTIKLLSKDDKALLKAKKQASQQVLVSGTPAAGPLPEPAGKTSQNITSNDKKQKRISFKSPFAKKDRQPIAQAA
ncbi:hypothetical protein L7F22_050232 [Adiantum nelumboides]|nr:hypothetical protein [Adiantum nelumboides]